MHQLQSDASSQSGRLLRILFIWVGQVSAHAGRTLLPLIEITQVHCRSARQACSCGPVRTIAALPPDIAFPSSGVWPLPAKPVSPGPYTRPSPCTGRLDRILLGGPLLRKRRSTAHIVAQRLHEALLLHGQRLDQIHFVHSFERNPVRSDLFIVTNGASTAKPDVLLSLPYGIVQKHNGRIDVQMEVGKGTTFRVTLPVKHVIPERQAVGNASAHA